MRETIIKLLTQIATENHIPLDLREGSSTHLFFVDALTLLLNQLIERIESSRKLSIRDVADTFLVSEGQSSASVFTVRLYFYEPISLSYGHRTMEFTSNGKFYYNKESVSWPASYMKMYEDGDYYYYDVVLTGDLPISASESLIWERAPKEYAYCTITSISSQGTTPVTDDELQELIRRQLSLRNNVTRHGIEGYLSSIYGASIRDILVQGYLDPLMKRDVYNGLHIGGKVDVYLKGPKPVDEKYVFENTEDVSVLMQNGYTICEDSLLPHSKLESFAMVSWIRPDGEVVTFTKDIDYSVTMDGGYVRLLRFSPGSLHNGNIRSGDFVRLTHIADISGKNVQLNPGLDPGDYVYPGHIIQFLDDGFELIENHIVKDLVGQNIVLDSNVSVNDPTYVRYLEPVRCIYTYHPVGCKLQDMKAPVLAIKDINVLDPVSEEETGQSIIPYAGFGHDIFGLGGFGVGNSSGYIVHIDNPFYRYSPREAGFIEIPREYEYEKIGINYITDPIVPIVQANIDENRAKPSDVLARSFTPTIVDIQVTVTGDTSTMSNDMVRDFIWNMSSSTSISSIVDMLYNMGADFVNIDDLYNKSQYITWSDDGYYTQLTPDPSGLIRPGSNGERFVPRNIVIIKGE